MAAKSEQETHYHHEHGANLIHVYSTQRGVWARCERLGLREVARDRYGRSYEGPAGTYRLSLNRRRAASGRPFGGGALAGRRGKTTGDAT